MLAALFGLKEDRQSHGYIYLPVFGYFPYIRRTPPYLDLKMVLFTVLEMYQLFVPFVGC